LAADAEAASKGLFIVTKQCALVGCLMMTMSRFYAWGNAAVALVIVSSG